MTTVVISDSSSLILLYKVGVLELWMDCFKVIIPAAVFRECCGTAAQHHPDARGIQQLAEQRRVPVLKAKQDEALRKKIGKWGDGETEMLLLFKQQKADYVVFAVDSTTAQPSTATIFFTVAP